MSSIQLPPGYHPPFAIVSDNDHTAWILIAASLGIVYSIIFGAIRAFVHYTTGRSFGPDDAVLAVSTIFGVVQSSVVLGACSDGLGKSMQYLSVDMQNKIQQMYYGSTLLFIIALGLSKISVVLFLLQLASSVQRRIFHGAVGFIAIWTVASFLAMALQCNLSHPWLLVGQKCSAVLLRWRVISAFDIVIEVAIVCMTLQLVWNLQTSWSKKRTIVAAFAFRLVMIGPIGFRLATFNTAGLTTNPTLLEDRFIVWTQVELHYSLISATIPCLRPVITRLVTHYGALGPAESRAYASGQSSSNVRNASYKMSNLKPYAGAHASSASSNRPKRIVEPETSSVGSNNSNQMIIKKDISWTVRHETI